jgi:hypothetical protein
VRRFVAFEAADLGVFVTRFAFFGQQDPDIGGWVNAVTIGWFEIAIAVRALVLVWCLVGWVRSTSTPARMEGRTRVDDALARTPA